MENDEGGKRAWEAERSISDVSKAIRNKALAQKVHDSASSKILFGHIPSRNIEQRILNMEIKANNEELWGVGVRGRGFMARTVERTPLVTKYWFGQGTTPYAGNSKGGPYPKEGHEKLYPEGAIDEMPDWITELVIKPIEEDGMVPEGWINSAVVLIYLPGGCIESHIDPPHLFRRPIITASFLSDTHLSFGCKFSSSSRAGPPVTQIPCRRGSVLSMAGFAADEISHCIRPEDINLRRAVIVLRHCPETAPRMTDEELGDLNKAEILAKTAKKEPSPKRSRRRSGRSRSRSRSKKRSRSRSKKRSRSPKRSRSRSSKKVSRSRSRSGPRRPRSPVRTHTRAGVRRSSSSRDREEERRKRNRERSVLPGKWGAGSVKKEDEDEKPTHHPTAALKFPKLESQPGSRVHDWCKQEGGGGGQGDKPYPEYQGRMVSSVMMGGDRCYKCQEKGHFARECPNKSEDRCFNCERDGHFIKDCPEPKRPRKERDSGAPPRWPMKEKHIRPKREEEEVKERSRSPISRSRQLEEVLKLQKRKDEVLKRLEAVRPRITKEEVKKEDDGLGDVSLTVEKIIAGDGSDHGTEKETFLQKIERIKAKLGDELVGDESKGGEQPDMKSLLKKLLQKEDVKKEDDTPEESSELIKLQERISSEEDKLKKIMNGEVFEDNEESDKEDGELEEDVEAEEAEESEAEKELGGEISQLRKELRLLKKRLRDDDVEVSEEECESVDDKSEEEDFSEDEGDKENLDDDEDSEGEEDETVQGKELQNAFELIKQTTAKSILSEKSKTWKAPKGSQTKLMNRILKSRLTDMQLEVEDSDEELEKERKIQEEEHARRKRRRSSKERRRLPPEQRQETYRRDKFEKVRQKLRGDSSSDDDEVIKKGKRSEFETMRRKMEKKQRDRMRDGERTRREEEEREMEREKKRRKVAEVTRMEERERSRRRSKERRRSRSRDRRRSRSSEWRRSPPRRRSRERISAREIRSRSPLESKFKYSEKYSTTSGYDRGAVLKRAEERYRKAGLVKAFDESSHEDESSEGDERSGSESPTKNFSLAGILKAEMETKEKIKKETDKIRKTAVLKDIAPLKNLFARKSEKKEEEKSRLAEALS